MRGREIYKYSRGEGAAVGVGKEYILMESREARPFRRGEREAETEKR